MRTIITFLKFLGPGVLVTVGFIDPGNWATNIAAGSEYGYKLLWVVTLSTLILIIIQHNVAKLGTVTGYCLAENISTHLPNKIGKVILGSGILATISTIFAEILGASIALNMIFHINIKLASLIVTPLILMFIYIYTYKKLEYIIIATVSVITILFIVELAKVQLDWPLITKSSVVPYLQNNSIIIVMGVLGAVVMPHNLFLHSEIIQSKHHNKTKSIKDINQRLQLQFGDTFFAMILGFLINSAIIILAATTFYKHNIIVEDISQTSVILKPILGNAAAIIFAVAFFLSGFASALTAIIAGGSIYSGIYNKPYNPKTKYTNIGIIIIVSCALIFIFIGGDPLTGLIYSQVVLSIQLPITMLVQYYLTSSKKVMGEHFKNNVISKMILLFISTVVIVLNIILIIQVFKNFNS